MRLFDKVAIVGVGLIGGSLALAMKKKKLARKIIGVSRHKKTLSLARKNRAIDEGTQDLSIVRDADLVILAAPVKTILRLAEKIAPLVKRDCVVIDVGSTKEEIVSKLDRLFSRYVGTHPLAGSEKRGINNADPFIFEGSLCILTPTKNTDPAAKRKTEELWRKLGVRVVFLSGRAHDRILSFISHLPHLAAFSLIGIAPRQYLRFAASGLKDTTRIAASDPGLWADIFLSNAGLLKAVSLFEDELRKIKSAIKSKDRSLLIKILKGAKKKRELLE
ncbi:MAG: prephenate dehydrogenase/arogenate dehydrogenase family protein [Candidatus Omnitrophota bacterium]|jgi:prephenate dehydrogenase